MTELFPITERSTREAAPGAGSYPHVCGAIPTEAVTAAVPVVRDGTGRMVLPDE